MENQQEKKPKKQVEKCVYGKKDPTNILQLNNKYIVAFLTEKKKEGKITQEQIDAFKADAKSINESEDTSRKKDYKIKLKFVEAFMPDLKPKTNQEFDFFAELDKL